METEQQRLEQHFGALVEKGIRLLNEKVPDWPAKIDLQTFSMYDTDRCVIAQLFPRKDDEISGYSNYGELGLECCGDMTPGKFGFDTHGSQNFDILQSIWTRRITELQKAA
jgi:hypothetical protein